MSVLHPTRTGFGHLWVFCQQQPRWGFRKPVTTIALFFSKAGVYKVTTMGYVGSRVFGFPKLEDYLRIEMYKTVGSFGAPKNSVPDSLFGK